MVLRSTRWPPVLTVSIGQGRIIDPSMLTVTPGTTRDEGGVEFRALVDELAPAAAKPLSGSVEWTCRS
jgi:hypothetical protein